MTTSASTRKGMFLSLRLRLLLVFTLLFLAALTTVFLWFRSFATSMALQDLQRDLRATAITTATGIDGDAHARLASGGVLDDSDYTAISEYLRAVKRTNPKASGIYTYIRDPDNPQQVQFVVSAALPPGRAPSISDEQLANQQLTDCQIPAGSRPDLRETYADTTPAMLNAFQRPDVDQQIWPDTWGEWLSGFAPVYDSQGNVVGAVGVDMCAADIGLIQQRVQTVLLPVFSGIVLLVSVAVFLLAYRITKPIIDLTRVADAIGQGRYDQRPATPKRLFRDEVDTLAQVVTFMTDKVAERETKLKQQVAELQIMVDDSKRKQQVDEIVDTDFFRDLQQKAREVRSRRDQQRPSET